MKVVHVLLTLECGGLEQVVVQLARKLKSDGIDSSVVCLQATGELAKNLEAEGIKVFALGKKPGLKLGLIFKLVKVLKAEKADVIHSHNMAPVAYSALAGLLTGIPSVNTRHGRTNKKLPWYIWALTKFVVPVSLDTKEHLLKYNRIAHSKIRVIYNGIDTSSYNGSLNQDARGKTRDELGLGSESFVIANVGRLSPEKDQATLLKAFLKIKRKKLDAELVIIGEGPKRADLEKLIDQFSLKESVKLLGYRTDVMRVLNACDVFVLSSYREGLSLSILEAMAAGKPVVATNVGGTREIVKERETGYLVPCGFPERIENAVIKLSINKELADKMADEGQKMVREKFSLERMAQEYTELYRQATGKK